MLFLCVPLRGFVLLLFLLFLFRVVFVVFAVFFCILGAGFSFSEPLCTKKIETKNWFFVESTCTCYQFAPILTQLRKIFLRGVSHSTTRAGSNTSIGIFRTKKKGQIPLPSGPREKAVKKTLTSWLTLSGVGFFAIMNMSISMYFVSLFVVYKIYMCSKFSLYRASVGQSFCPVWFCRRNNSQNHKWVHLYYN